MTGRCALLALVLGFASCGPPPPPSYITDVQALEASPASQKARSKAPALYKKGMEAMQRALEAFEGGDEPAARDLALESSILFKTAIAVSRQKGASARVAKAETRISEAGDDLARMQSLRLDAQDRFLALLAFHDEQADTADALMSAFVKDTETLDSLTDQQAEAWKETEEDRLAGILQTARSTTAAARALGCKQLLPSETEETLASIEKATGAQADEWKIFRPLVDDASLRADRLLVHTRAMAKPDALTNPASDKKTVERFIKAMKGSGAMVSATRRGILVSFKDPATDAGKLTGATTEALELLAGAIGAPQPLLVESWTPSQDADDLALEAAESLANSGQDRATIATSGWGTAPYSDPGHCLVQKCSTGRLDVVILSL